jgi:hypothetical protein
VEDEKDIDLLKQYSPKRIASAYILLLGTISGYPIYDAFIAAEGDAEKVIELAIELDNLTKRVESCERLEYRYNAHVLWGREKAGKWDAQIEELMRHARNKHAE